MLGIPGAPEAMGRLSLSEVEPPQPPLGLPPGGGPVAALAFSPTCAAAPALLVLAGDTASVHGVSRAAPGAPPAGSMLGWWPERGGLAWRTAAWHPAEPLFAALSQGCLLLGPAQPNVNKWRLIDMQSLNRYSPDTGGGSAFLNETTEARGFWYDGGRRELHITYKELNQGFLLWFILNTNDIYTRARYIKTTANIWDDRLSRDIDYDG
eukprot:jgi/Tetstr1/436127/TSEL_024974.t1